MYQKFQFGVRFSKSEVGSIADIATISRHVHKWLEESFKIPNNLLFSTLIKSADLNYLDLHNRQKLYPYVLYK